MKYILKATLFVSIAVCGGGCTSAYWGDRGRDALDMVSFGYGAGWGVKVQGFGKIGLLVDFPHAGLRGGEFVQSEVAYSDILCRNMDEKIRKETDAEGVFLIIGASRFKTAKLRRGKNHDYYHLWTQVKGDLISVPEYTNVEVCIGLGPSVRFGINPGEILDFLLGWFSLDIYGDDLGKCNKQDIEQVGRPSGLP